MYKNNVYLLRPFINFLLPLKRDTNENPDFSEEKVGHGGSTTDLCDLHMLHCTYCETD